jgi:hypothetical protein
MKLKWWKQIYTSKGFCCEPLGRQRRRQKNTIKHIPTDIPQVLIGGLSNPNELDSYAGEAMFAG